MDGRERPNLLYILSDQHSPFVTGCYGDSTAYTPNLDGLAARGVTFDNGYCTSPLCVPSRMSMLTGQHPYRNRVWTNEHILDASVPTFAHALGAGGYRPVIIGRMHSIGPDQLHGYVERLVGDHSPNYVGGRPVDHGELQGTAGPARISLEKSGVGQSAYQVHDEYVTAATIDYLTRIGLQRRLGESADPFALTVGFMLPHQPFVARPEDYQRYDGRIPLPRHSAPAPDDDHPHVRTWRQQTGIETVSEAEILRARTAYWSLVTRLDSMIGQILTALRDNGLAENTIVVYMSDHGEQVGEHGLWWKQTFYEGSARVPIIISWPNVLPAGTRCERVVSSLDVMATMLDAVGAPTLPHAQGRSLIPTLVSDAEWEDIAFSEYCTYDGWYQRMVRSGPWKLNYYHNHPPQLFNLETDPDELNDLASDPTFQRVREALVERVLDGWDPKEIAEEMAAKRADGQIIEAWARATQPPDQYRWDLRPEMDYLTKGG